MLCGPTLALEMPPPSASICWTGADKTPKASGITSCGVSVCKVRRSRCSGPERCTSPRPPPKLLGCEHTFKRGGKSKKSNVPKQVCAWNHGVEGAKSNKHTMERTRYQALLHVQVKEEPNQRGAPWVWAPSRGSRYAGARRAAQAPRCESPSRHPAHQGHDTLAGDCYPKAASFRG